MIAYPWESNTVYIGVDPAQKRSGFAYSLVTPDGDRVRGTYSVESITEAFLVESFFSRVVDASCYPNRKVVLVVEYPKWNAGASTTVRAAANAWIRLFKRHYPRKVEVRKVDPNEWQATFSYRSRPLGTTTKEYSKWLASKVYGWGELSEDEADAALILEYGRLTPPKARKKRKARG